VKAGEGFFENQRDRKQEKQNKKKIRKKRDIKI